MNWTDGYTSINDQKIYFQTWATNATPLANIILVHGLGEHSGRYADIGEFFAESDFNLIAMDLMGHGKSEGQRGHADSFEDYCDIVEHFLLEQFKKFPNTPIYLYGHSMGGLIVLYYAYHRDISKIQGTIVTSPGLATGFKVPGWKTLVGNILYSLAPKFSMENGLPLDGISQDKSVVEAYKKDPLNHPLISARMGMDLIRNGAEISKHAADFPLPLLLMVGSDDIVISPQAVIEFGVNGGNTTTLKVWQGGFHELHNEPFKKEVWLEILVWIKKYVTNA